MGTDAELQTAWARLVVASLVDGGVREAVISPGSQSTPFVVAALEHPSLRCHSVFDERSAAHFALGQARSTGRASLVVCTSGSAVANYFPAVVEAYESGLPLVVLSADRPPELLGVGANQTTDQIEMFGGHVQFFANLGEPGGDIQQLRAVRRTAARAIDAAHGPRPGPVHLNAQARKPLEPVAPTSAEAIAREAQIEALLAEPLPRVHASRGVDAAAVAEVADAIEAAERPVILAGPVEVWQESMRGALLELAERTGALVLAEPASQLRFGPPSDRVCGGFDALWSSTRWRLATTPDFVLQFGASPVSGAWERLNQTAQIPRVVVHPWAWADPASNAGRFVRATPHAFVAALAQHTLAATPARLEFAGRMIAAERRVWSVAKAVLNEAGTTLTEAAVAPALFESAPAQSAIVLGNSLPIRNVAQWVAPSEKPLRVFSQRGVSGIDGLVSAAAGTSSCEAGPTALLIGDVSFLHDLNGLALAARAERPLVVVVINNGGGRIFEQLPIAERGGDWLPFFTTPHQADLRSAARVYGCHFASVKTPQALDEALAKAYLERTCTVIEALVPPESARQQAAALRARVEDEAS